MMMLDPSYMIAKVGTVINLTCKYNNTEKLDIIFVEGDTQFSQSYTTNTIDSYVKPNIISRRRQLILTMQGYKRTIKCYIVQFKNENQTDYDKRGELTFQALSAGFVFTFI